MAWDTRGIRWRGFGEENDKMVFSGFAELTIDN